SVMPAAGGQTPLPQSRFRGLEPRRLEVAMDVKLLARRTVRALACCLPVLAAGGGAALAQGEVNIYSYREPQLIDPLLKAFTEKTGIKANVVYAAAGLNERLAAEGQNSPADLLFTV